MTLSPQRHGEVHALEAIVAQRERQQAQNQNRPEHLPASRSPEEVQFRHELAGMSMEKQLTAIRPATPFPSVAGQGPVQMAKKKSERPPKPDPEKWDSLPEKVQNQITKARLPYKKGSHPFVPNLIWKSNQWQIEKKVAPNAQGRAKNKPGYVDTQGRPWVFDPAHAGYPDHFDVQVDGGSTYLRVTPDGEIAQKKK